MVSMLQLPPPLELAVGQLSSAEQSHAQISLRVLAAHLKAPCIVVSKDVGDITLKPNEQDSGSIRVVSAYGEARLERPIRLVPLSEALSKLIDGILAQTDQPAPVAIPSQPTGVQEAPTALLELLLTRSHNGPLEVQFASGDSLVLDERYSVAHFSSPVADMLPTLANDSIVAIWPMSNEEFARRTAKDNPLHPISVEQVCWSLPATADSAPALDRWHRDPQSRVKLETWPNLSAQQDAHLWLEVLAKLFQRDMTVGGLRDAAMAAGISAARAHHGISMLLTYRHAHIVAASNVADTVVVQMPVTRRAPSNSMGLLGRLRSRLRALAA